MIKLKIVDKNNIIFDGDKYFHQNIYHDWRLKKVIDFNVEVYRSGRFECFCSIRHDPTNFNFYFDLIFNRSGYISDGSFLPISWKSFLNNFSRMGIKVLSFENDDLANTYLKKMKKFGLKVKKNIKIKSPTEETPDVFYSDEGNHFYLCTTNAINFTYDSYEYSTGDGLLYR